MAFGKAKKQVRYAKISIRGTLKSGKTVTAAMLAAYIAKKYHPGKPVAFVPTEPGIDFVLNIFETEGIPVNEPVDKDGNPLRSRDYVVLKNSIPEAVEAGAGVYLVDNLTHFRENLVRAHKLAIGALKFRDGKKVSDRKLKPFEYMPINEEWAEYTAQLTAAPLDIIVLGRLGKIFEELENDEGETDIHQIGNKMKAGSDTEYEVDLMAEMESRPDPAFANAEKVNVLGPVDPVDGSRKVRRKKLVRKFEHRNIHVFTVAGCRVWALNGQVCIMKSAVEYKKGMCDVIGEFCEPYLTFLKTGDGGAALKATSIAQLSETAATIFGNGNGDTNGSYLRKRENLETWEATVKVIFKDSTALCRQQKQFVCERITETRSMTAFAHQTAEQIAFQLLILQKFELRSKSEGIPEKQDDLGALVDLAREEAEHEWKVIHGQPQTPTPEPAGNQAEIPW